MPNIICVGRIKVFAYFFQKVSVLSLLIQTNYPPTAEKENSMRALIQRVTHAAVSVDGEVKGSIQKGFLILLGVKAGDTEEQARFLAKKTAELRVFTDSEDKMNLSLLDIGGEALVVSQFTLYADCKKGRRPAFVNAEKPPVANELYEKFVELMRQNGVKEVQTGVFGAHMMIELENDGPVTIMLDTDEIMPGRN